MSREAGNGARHNDLAVLSQVALLVAGVQEFEEGEGRVVDARAIDMQRFRIVGHVRLPQRILEFLDRWLRA